MKDKDKLQGGKKPSTAHGAEIIPITKGRKNSGPRRSLHRIQADADHHFPEGENKAAYRGQSSKGGRGLTPKQERFALLVAEGHSLAEAYRQSYSVGETTKPSTIYRQGQILASKPAIAARITEEVNRLEGERRRGNREIREYLRDTLQGIISDVETRTSDRLRAVELLGKVGGVGLFVEQKAETENKAGTKEELAKLEQRLVALLRGDPVDKAG